MNIIEWDGKPISKPGLYAKVPMAAYHGGRLCISPSITKTGLWTIFNESEADFYDSWPINPDYAPKEESEALILGRAAHHLWLGQPHFAAEYAVRPDVYPDGSGKLWSGNAKVCKDWLADRAAEGRDVLTNAQLERVKGMSLSFSKHHFVRQGALRGEVETTMAWQDQETGVWLLNRPDVIPTDAADIIDPKTTTSIAYPDIVKAIGDFGYYAQGALVAEGYQAITGRKIASFSLFFIESRRPYSCALYRLKDEDLELGRRVVRHTLRRFVRALNTGVWPGPGGEQTGEWYAELSLRQREIAEARMR